MSIVFEISFANEEHQPIGTNMSRHSPDINSFERLNTSRRSFRNWRTRKSSKLSNLFSLGKPIVLRYCIFNLYHCHTVDGRNPASRNPASKVVQDFFHPQYLQCHPQKNCKNFASFAAWPHGCYERKRRDFQRRYESSAAVRLRLLPAAVGGGAWASHQLVGT